MAGVTKVVTAKTKTALKKECQKWQRQAREAGMDIHLGYDDSRIQKTDDGEYAILLRAHS